VNRHRARLALDFNTLAGQLVERLAVALQAEYIGGIWRIGPRKRARAASSSLGSKSDRATLDDTAIGIAGIGRDAEQEVGFVGLVGGEQIAENLVASPKQSGNRPLASGSSVPVCPALAAETGAAQPAAPSWRSCRSACRAAKRRQRAASSCFTQTLFRIGIGLIRDRRRLADQLRQLSPRSSDWSKTKCSCGVM
jgi:hypothetical protein